MVMGYMAKQTVLCYYFGVTNIVQGFVYAGCSKSPHHCGLLLSGGALTAHFGLR